MAQYCRYCAFCFEADDFRCSNHPRGEEPHWTEEQIKRVNHCKNFSLSTDLINCQNSCEKCWLDWLKGEKIDD